MNQFYFVRHGQTQANSQGLTCGGQWDLALNELGVQQAHSAGQWLLQHFAKQPQMPQWMVTSSLLRARSTADILAQHLQLSVAHDDQFREWCVGSWEAQPWEHVRELFLGSGEPPGGEARHEFHSRVHKGFQMALSKPKPFILVSHGGVWMALQDALGLERFRIHNCEIVHVRQNQAQHWSAQPIWRPS